MEADSNAEQRALDAQIAILDLEIAALRRRRNELSPIASVPPEILCEILLMATCMPVTDAPDSVEQMRTDNYIKTLCHVSHSWRSIAVGCPSLWAAIDIHRGMSGNAKRLNFLVNHAHPIPLSLCMDEEAGDWPVLRQALGAIKQILSQHNLSFQQLIYRGNPHDLLDSLSPRTLNAALHTVRIIDSTGTTGYRTWWPGSREIPQNALFSGVAPNLRILDLVGFSIPLTSPLLLSPHLTRITLSIPRESNARQVMEILQNTRQLQELNMSLPYDLHLPSSVRPLVPTRLLQLATLVLSGTSTSVLVVLEQLRLSGRSLQLSLESALPTSESFQEFGNRLLAAIGVARIPSAKCGISQNQPILPTGIGIKSSSGDSSLYGVYVKHADNIDPLDRGLMCDTYMDIRLYELSTRAPIRYAEWHPIFSTCHPETFLQNTGWSLANLTVIGVADQCNDYPRMTFWKLMSRILSVQVVIVSASHILDFLPFLYAPQEETQGDPATCPFPGLLDLDVTGSLSADGGSELLLQPVVVALERRGQLALECQGASAPPLNLLMIRNCKSPPNKDLLGAIPATLVKDIRWELLLDTGIAA